jgi:hypothetical protein
VSPSKPAQTDRESLQRFTWLLNQRAYRFWPEDKLDEVISVRRKKPDFYVRTASGDLLVEVESFVERLSRPAQAMAVNPEREWRRIQGAVRHGAQQLGDYKDLNLPMMVVVDNWRRVGVPTDVGTLWGALFTAQGQSQPLLNSKNKRYVSAVAWNLPKARTLDDTMTNERPMYLVVLHNPYADISFCRSFFDSINDKHFRINRRGRPILF